jgi:hypothetical protein
MSDIDDQLNRLFRAAGKTEEQNFVPPFGMETRVLAAWREADSFSFWSTPLLLRGLIVAGAIMALSLLPALEKTSTPDADYLQLADSTLTASSSP